MNRPIGIGKLVSLVYIRVDCVIFVDKKNRRETNNWMLAIESRQLLSSERTVILSHSIHILFPFLTCNFNVLRQASIWCACALCLARSAAITDFASSNDVTSTSFPSFDKSFPLVSVIAAKGQLSIDVSSKLQSEIESISLLSIPEGCNLPIYFFKTTFRSDCNCDWIGYFFFIKME